MKNYEKSVKSVKLSATVHLGLWATALVRIVHGSRLMRSFSFFAQLFDAGISFIHPEE
jgi:hypothetical protein